MQRAIRISRRGEGRVEPNPMVGCVIVRNGRILAEGYHQKFGEPHAEANALQACGHQGKGATAYVSLEPCCHYGKTPPCADAIIAAGITEVVATFGDPNPLVSGRGFKKLKAGGVRVRTGVLAEQAAALLAPFATGMKLGRPYVIAKWAQGPDGGLTRPQGQSPWISCETSRHWVHRLRARMDAIVVGIGTVLQDDPLLTARGVPLRRRALRVVLDSRLRIPERCRLVATAEEIPTVVFTSAAKARSAKAHRLTARGLQIETCPQTPPAGARIRRASRVGLDVRSVLRRLSKSGATNVLVEGGPTLLRSYFEYDLVDEAHMFVAPIYLNPATSGDRIARLKASRVNLVHSTATPGLATLPFAPLDSRERGRSESSRNRLSVSPPPQGLTDVLSLLQPSAIEIEPSGTDAHFRIQVHNPMSLWTP